jgi:hypothetical protein
MGIYGFARLVSLNTSRPYRTDFLSLSCDINVLVVIVAIPFPTGGDISDNRQEVKGVKFDIWMGIEKYSLVFWTLGHLRPIVLGHLGIHWLIWLYSKHDNTRVNMQLR